MSKLSPQSYADWKAPSEDGQMLIWPDPAQILADTRQNAAKLNGETGVAVQGIPLPALRQRARHFIGHRTDEQPLIATGHQTELFHPGVWVKNALINSVAAKVEGAAFHFAVDTDAPKHLHLRWPGGSRVISDDPGVTSAEWCGLLQSPTPLHLAGVEAEFNQAAAGWSFSPMVEPFLTHLRRLLLEPQSLSATLTNSIHAIDWQLGLRHHALILSPVWVSDPYLVYVHHLIARAGAFASAYNESLDAYRREQGILTAARPMPNLDLETDAREVPFWLDDLRTGSRERARVRLGAGGLWELHSPVGDTFPFDPRSDGWEAAAKLARWLRQQDLRLAPRALTLTLFFRLLLVDQFVHGIGGGRYDQVTDALIGRFFKIEPPRFAVTTATLHFPAAVGQRRINLRPLLQEGRRIRHGLLSREKREAVARIAELPRKSRERHEVFSRMHARLAMESDGPAVRRWEAEFRAAERRSAEQRVLFDRELFFAVQPRERLTGMIERYDEQFA